MKNYIYSNNLILNRVLIGISFFSVLSLKLLKLSTRIQSISSIAYLSNHRPVNYV